MNSSINRPLIRNMLTSLGLVSFKNSYWFKHSKNIRMKIQKLKKQLRKEGISDEEIRKRVEELKDKEDKKLYDRSVNVITETVYDLIRSGKNRRKLNKIPYYKKWYLEKYIDFLIHHGMVKAIYTGPKPREFKDNVCRKTRSVPEDPWDNNPYRSGELKIWLLYTTANKKLREKRLKCWAPYIVLDFSPLIEKIRQNNHE